MGHYGFGARSVSVAASKGLQRKLKDQPMRRTNRLPNIQPNRLLAVANLRTHPSLLSPHFSPSRSPSSGRHESLPGESRRSRFGNSEADIIPPPRRLTRARRRLHSLARVVVQPIPAKKYGIENHESLRAITTNGSLFCWGSNIGVAAFIVSKPHLA